jgi:hypothetical protein
MIRMQKLNTEGQFLATFLWWMVAQYHGLQQELVTLSTPEAEYVAQTHAAKEAS